MKKTILIAMMICGLMTGLIATKGSAFEIITEEDLVRKIVVETDLIKTADNAIILMDSSDSMGKTFPGTNMSRYEIMVQTLKERNKRLPDLGYNIGLYTYNPWKAIYPVQAYDSDSFAAALDRLPKKPKGPTMLQQALHKLGPILENLSGRTVVFIVTDGTFSKMPGLKPAAKARQLAEKHNVCFYVISTADDRASQRVLETVASFDFCSRVVPFAAFIGRPEFNTGALYVVRATARVETVTEERIVGIKLNNIQFGFDRADIGSEFKTRLNRLGSFLEQNPDTYAVVAGFTDSTGSEEYNLGLSMRRAIGVSEYIVSNFNVTPDRLVPLWFGKANPLAGNDTREGRRMNRRVEIAVAGM
jgi:OOP family OmpA-OmpF porin